MGREIINDARRTRMHEHTVMRDRWALRAMVALTVVMALLSTGPQTIMRAAGPPVAATVTTGNTTTNQTFVRRLDGPVTARPRAGQPVRLKIPMIGVDAAVEQVGQTPDGAMDVPKNFDETAWYQPGARPGEPGNAVIDGHVDSTTGKAVFWDLRTLVRGDQIVVVGDDGVERRFAVVATETYTSANVPLDRVFGATTGTHLNLITCDQRSAFNPAVHSYDGNIVVYSELAP